MIVLIAPEKDIKNEMVILNQLFEAGLEFYHLRKPLKDYKEHCDYLKQIDAQFHNRIVVHFHHELINEYNLKGIHFQEQKRKDHLDNSTNYFTDLNLFGKTISSSFHNPNDIYDCDFEFDYHLLSPVFSSISKSGYEGEGFDVNETDKLIVGMGGASVDNIPAFKKLGFKGVGVLGGIWMSSSPIANFTKMKQSFNHIDS